MIHLTRKFQARTSNIPRTFEKKTHRYSSHCIQYVICENVLKIVFLWVSLCTFIPYRNPQILLSYNFCTIELRQGNISTLTEVSRILIHATERLFNDNSANQHRRDTFSIISINEYLFVTSFSAEAS